LFEGETMKSKIAHALSAVALLAFWCASVPTLARQTAESVPLGLVEKTSGAQIGNATATEGLSVYSGDYLTTSDKGLLLLRIGTLSLELEGSSAVHIYSTPYGAVAELNHGSVLYTTPGGEKNLVIVASDVRITPILSNADFGRVAMDDPCDITVQSQRGEVNVKVGSEQRTIEQGKAYRVHAENQISYRRYLSPDAEDYHRYHEHTPCAALDMVSGHAPVAPGSSHFLLVAAGLIGAGTGIGIWKVIESPDRP
jgi:hypothetical protein